jgi:amidase
VSERDGDRIAHGTAAGDYGEVLQAASEEAARLLVDRHGFSIEEAFVFLSVACDVGVCQACQPSRSARSLESSSRRSGHVRPLRIVTIRP